MAGRGEQPGLVSLQLPFLSPLLHKLLLVLRNPSRPGNEERTAPTLPGLAEAGLVTAHTQERLVRRQASQGENVRLGETYNTESWSDDSPAVLHPGPGPIANHVLNTVI